MSAPSIQEMIILSGSSIKEALAVIEQNAQGTCFVVNKTGAIIGVLTDGDIRRSLLNGVSLNDLVDPVMQGQFTSLPVSTSPDKIQSALNSKIRIIPLLDEKRVPVDYASVGRIHRIPIMEPLLDGNELQYVTECVKTGWISSQGAFVREFEKKMAEFCDMPYGLAVSNGTVALHLALVALGIGEGDEVIVPDITFAASINTIIHAGAVPVLADIMSDTWTIDPAEVEKLITKRTKAIMPVHLYGHPCHMDELTALARKHGLYIVEDCAESLGSEYKGRPTGSFSDAASFSFFGNKTITTGEGGMILFRDKKVYEKAAVLRDHGMSKERKYWHEFVGYNYRMTNLQAAIGVAQMERAGQFIEAKRRIARSYNEILSKIPGFTTPPEMTWAKNSYWLYTAMIGKETGISRDDLISKLLKNGVETRPAFYPLHIMPPYLRYIRPENSFSRADHFSANGISFPSSVTLKSIEIESIEKALGSIFSARALSNSKG